jgi:hypothetical protein
MKALNRAVNTLRGKSLGDQEPVAIFLTLRSGSNNSGFFLPELRGGSFGLKRAQNVSHLGPAELV